MNPPRGLANKSDLDSPRVDLISSRLELTPCEKSTKRKLSEASLPPPDRHYIDTCVPTAAGKKCANENETTRAFSDWVVCCRWILSGRSNDIPQRRCRYPDRHQDQN